MDLAIVIVSWNVCDLLAACLRSVRADLANSRLSGQIWVVDNASSDDSTVMIRRDFPEVKLIASEQNLGFAGGNNAALRALGFGDATDHSSETQQQAQAGEGDLSGLPRAVLLLNPDTELHPGALQALFDFLEATPEAGLAGARLVYGDGTFQHGAFGFPGLWQLAIELLPLPGRLVESRLNGRYARSLYERGEPFQIGHPLGAAMCIRREALQQTGLLDESYHMYVEEIDWSKRMAAAGWRAYCVPRAVITHFSGQSTGQIKTSSFINLWRSRYQFYRRYYHPLKLWLARQIVRFGLRRQERNDLRAAAQGRLTEAELSTRQAGYRQVARIWQGR